MALFARLFDRIFGARSRLLARARSAELRGDSDGAVTLYGRGGRPDEALRVRKTRARGALTRMRPVPVTVSGRRAMVDVADELESLGDFTEAAEAYALARDLEGQARALRRGGEVERLDDLLAAEQGRAREAFASASSHDEFEMLVASGRRREAVAFAEGSSDVGLRSRGRAVHARHLAGAVVHAFLRGRPCSIVLGDRVVVGRGDGTDESREDDASTGTLAVSSRAVSRRHLAMERRDGVVWIRDLGTHNGTLLKGVPMTGEVSVGSGIELRLGNQVSLALSPADEWPGALIVAIGGQDYVAPLGPATLGIGEWRLERVVGASGDWIELVTGEATPAFRGGLRLASRVSLLAGDAFATERDAEPVLRLATRSARA